MGPGRPGAVTAGRAPSTASLAAALAAREKAVASFRGQGRLRYQGPSDSFRSSQMIVVEAPSSIRIDVMHPFGISYSLATDGARLTALDHGDKIFYTGTATARNLGRFAGVAIEPAALAALIRGLPPPLDVESEGGVAAAEGGWLWTRPVPGGGQASILFSADGFEPLRFTFGEAAAEARSDALFGDYRAVGGVRFPHKIQVYFADGGYLELVYGTVWLDRPADASAFVLAEPAGIQRVLIDSEDAARPELSVN